jgi:hypothetical protein
MDMMLAADIVAFSPLSFWRLLGGFPTFLRTGVQRSRSRWHVSGLDY